MVYTLFEKLRPVKILITQGHDDWEEWDLVQLTENLQMHVDRTSLKADGENNADNGSR